ncbi:MAG: capsular polysaccharide synthesis protein [Prevotella pectinovora]
MKDFDKFKKRFVQFGGWRLILQYARMGVFWTGVKVLLRCVVSGKSLKAAYPAVTERVDEILIERYRHILDENKDRFSKANPNSGKRRESAVSRIIWSAWLQGLDNAPEMVNVCLESHQKHLPGYEFRVLDMENYRQWVELPEWVEEKYARGMIPAALFSDVLRVAVLKRYGGVWMDASVLCTGFDNQQLQKQWAEVENSRFAVFRYYRKGDRYPSGLSNWFIAATPDNIVLTSVYDMLTAYWRDYDCTIDYYMMHLFISCALKAFPEMERGMPKLNSRYSFFLGDALSRTYSQEAWQELVDHVAIHKLNYRKAEEAQKNPLSYYNFIRK